MRDNGQCDCCEFRWAGAEKIAGVHARSLEIRPGTWVSQATVRVA
jgi:hypothetical protein